MSCTPGPGTFRLLDAWIGWDPDTGGDVPGTRDITGFDDPEGIRLAHRDVPEGPTRSSLLPWFPDRRLAPGCRPGSWYLLVPGRNPRLLRRDGCGDWLPVWPPECGPSPLRRPVSVAARGNRIAVVEPGRVLVWDRAGERLTSVVVLPGARRAALAPGGELLVARRGRTDLRRYGPDGRPRGTVRTGATGEVIGVRAGPDGTVWLLTEDRSRLWLHRGGRGGPFHPATVAELAAALPPSTLVSAGADGFCLREPGPESPVTSCFTWCGAPRATPPPPGGTYPTSGVLLTRPIDSGIARCRWHRVRVEATVPPGTSVAVEVVVSEDDQYEESDWQRMPPGLPDVLVDQPPGRFLRLRLRLASDGSATPVIRRVRLDFPRVTSADLLPPAFREDPAADDFTERFLSLFDATLSGLDRTIERMPALLDPDGVPDRALPWLAGLLGLAYESGWSAAIRRELLAAAPELYRRRGTPWALREAVRIVFGVAPVIDESAADRRWAQIRAAGAPGGEGLGTVRLFGRSAGRFRVGGSALGTAPLRAFGDPDADPLTAHAFRFRLLLPAGSVDERALARLVRRQAPAHTVGSVRTGGGGFVVGPRSTVGVDTAFVPLPPPVLGGARPPRLNRDAVLRPGPRGTRCGVGVGVVSAVGVHTWMS
ncbi:phage tail protein [Streptomyces sp. NPDC000594]|uniref:phage tail protein n=1 Tax=Streptomyces sp. NPDC000594 TaxID=3154261 RepID=UPI00331AF04A